MAASRTAHRAKPIPISVSAHLSSNFGYSSHHQVGSPEPMFQFDESEAWTNYTFNQADSPPQNPRITKIGLPKKCFQTRKGNNILVGATALSLPVNIPDPLYNRQGSGDDDQDGEGGDWIPPHEYLARRWGATTLSVHEGVGRTLKGRDLRQVRNAVWSKVGLED